MNVKDTRRYEMLVRVRDFGTAYGHLFPQSSVGRQKFDEVNKAIEEVEAHALTRMTESAPATANQKAKARKALGDGLLAISQTATVLAREVPALDGRFEMPRITSDQATLIAGRKFARDVEPFKSHFIAHGMATTFVADFEALVDGFERALRARGMGRDERVAASAGIKTAIASGVDAVRALDVIVSNYLHQDQTISAVWGRDRRIVYPGSTSSRTTPEPATPATPAVAVTA